MQDDGKNVWQFAGGTEKECSADFKNMQSV